MRVIAEYTVTAGDFVLGRATPPGMQVDLERFVSQEDRVVPYFWAALGNHEKFERDLRRLDEVLDLTRIDDLQNQYLYRCVCDPANDTLTGGVLRHDAEMLCASGDESQWRFKLGFDDATVLSDFQMFVVDRANVNLQLEHIYNPVESAPGIRSKLTPRQRETLLTAHEEGYFDIPRKITLVDLAEKLGISDQAVSERMRRGESKLIRAHLQGELAENDGE